VTVNNDRVFVSYRSFLWALDKKTGQPIKTFGKDGRIDLREGLDQPAEKLSVSASTPGSIFEDLLIMGSSVPETLPGSPGRQRRSARPPATARAVDNEPCSDKSYAAEMGAAPTCFNRIAVA